MTRRPLQPKCKPMELTDRQKDIINADGHLLVTGGPGSGKTTVSILKAAQIVQEDIHPGQKVLFLSFARASVSRVVEAIEIEQQIPDDQKKRIEVETYHSFFWRILKTHGYLVGLPRKISLLSPPNEAIALSEIRNRYPAASKMSDAQKSAKCKEEGVERQRLAMEDGSVCFDLFARYTSQILSASERIRKLAATMYPAIILDEFQDTNAEQWEVVEALGNTCRILALADPEQRIYDWIGADPKRLTHFREKFQPVEVDLRAENHRSAGTDIAEFGNDILKGKFGKSSYTGVDITPYKCSSDSLAASALATATFQARGRLVKSKKDWSLAILVPTKRMTRLVSDIFHSPPGNLQEIRHRAVIEMEAAILGAEIVSFLMQPGEDDHHCSQFVRLICGYYRGKGGAIPTKKDLREAENIRKSHIDFIERRSAGKEIKRKSIFAPMLATYAETREAALEGNPEKDWLTIRKILEDGQCPRLKELAQEVRNVRLLGRGDQLRQTLSQDWRDNGAYTNALNIVRQAFVQEHFSMTSKPESGVVVMNMHKSKGKQFDEVIIFEGRPKTSRGQIVANTDRIVRANIRDNDNDQARQNMRVSVTRGKSHVTILTPKRDPCILLLEEI